MGFLGDMGEYIWLESTTVLRIARFQTSLVTLTPQPYVVQKS